MKLLIRIFSFLLIAAFCGFAASAKKQAVFPKPDDAGARAMPFSPGILVDGTLYVAGMTGPDPKTGKIPEDFAAEVKNALDRAGEVLKKARYDFKDVVTVQVYLADIGQIGEMNKVYLTYFPEPRPARTTVGVAKLVGTSRIEITVTAKK